jgi:hypothetical protein
MQVRRLGTTIEVTTPAKINLFLEVLARRSDGFHEIETLLAAVSLYDTLRFTAGGSELSLECRCAGAGSRNDIPSGPENLAWRAAALVRQRSGSSAGWEGHRATPRQRWLPPTWPGTSAGRASGSASWPPSWAATCRSSSPAALPWPAAAESNCSRSRSPGCISLSFARR